MSYDPGRFNYELIPEKENFTESIDTKATLYKVTSEFSANLQYRKSEILLVMKNRYYEKSR